MSDKAAEIVAAVCADTGWTEEEAWNVLRCIRADSPDALMEHAPIIIDWCQRAETRASIVSLMKTLPPGVLEVQWQGDDIAMRLSPNIDVQMLPDGVMNIVTKGVRA